MSEISKLYKNAEVKKQIPKVCSSNELYCKECEAHIEDAMPYCKNAEYPPFTAEKQIELIKLLGNVRDYIVEISKFKGIYYVGCRSAGSNDKFWGSSDTFEYAIAELVNEIWLSLTKKEKQQIKAILE